MYHKLGWTTGITMLAAVGSATAQSTGVPSFDAPYRAFAQHEFGGTLSFPSRCDFGIEGQYRFGYRNFDIGFRGGFLQSDAPAGRFADTRITAGVAARQRVITHSVDFPLDGAIVFGIGGQFVSDRTPGTTFGTTVFIPFGVSLGRRLEIENSQVSIVPYGQPTVFLTTGSNQDTDLRFSLGLGADFRLSSVFAARASVGVGSNALEGFAASAVWIR